MFCRLSCEPQNPSNKRKKSCYDIVRQLHTNRRCDRKRTIVYCILSVFVGNRTWWNSHSARTVQRWSWVLKVETIEGITVWRGGTNAIIVTEIDRFSCVDYCAGDGGPFVGHNHNFSTSMQRQRRANRRISIPCQSAIAIQRGKSIKRCQTINHYYYYDKSLPLPDFHPQAIFEWSRSDVEQQHQSQSRRTAQIDKTHFFFDVDRARALNLGQLSWCLNLFIM